MRDSNQINVDQYSKATQWMDNSWDELYAWVVDNTLLDPATTMVRVSDNLMHCVEATTPKQFLLWAKRLIKQTMADGLINATDVLDINRVIEVAKNNRPRTNRLMEYEIHNDVAFINLSTKTETHVWMIPADKLELAKVLWPCYAMKRANGVCVCKRGKRVRADGTFYWTNVSLHRAITDILGNHAHCECRNKNWLDWLTYEGKPNIYVSESIREEKFYQLDAENLHDPNAFVTNIEGMSDPNLLPAKSTAVPNYEGEADLGWFRENYFGKMEF